MSTKYTVIKDTREHKNKGWTFKPSIYCNGMIQKALQTGDYSLLDYETTLTIERKGRIAEFIGNICQKRFDNELKRMRGYKYAYILLEFTMDDVVNFPLGSGIPARRLKYMKMTGAFILKRIIEIQMEYPNIHILFVGKRGADVASSIFKRVIERENGKAAS